MWRWYCCIQTKILNISYQWMFQSQKNHWVVCVTFLLNDSWLLHSFSQGCLSFYAFFLVKVLRGKVMKLGSVIYKQAQAWSSLLLELCDCQLSVCTFWLVDNYTFLESIYIRILFQWLLVEQERILASLLILDLTLVQNIEPVVSESHVGVLWIHI